MERDRRQEREPAKNYIVYCMECATTLAENLPLCMAQEAAQFHTEDTDHQVYLFTKDELIIHDRRM